MHRAKGVETIPGNLGQRIEGKGLKKFKIPNALNTIDNGFTVTIDGIKVS